MRTTLLAVGKLRPSFRDASDEYLTRIRRYASFEEREIREAGRSPTPIARRKEETSRIAAALPAGATIVLLTHQVKEKQAQAALAEISAQPTTRQIGVVLRVLS